MFPRPGKDRTGARTGPRRWGWRGDGQRLGPWQGARPRAWSEEGTGGPVLVSPWATEGHRIGGGGGWGEGMTAGCD